MDHLKQSQEIAANLGPGFTASQDHDMQEQFVITDGRSPDFALVFRFNGYQQQGRITISGRYAGKYEDHPGSAPAAITCSQKRTPRNIARDIHNRFLPAYVKAYEEGLKTYFTRRSRENWERDTLEMFAAAIDGQVNSHYSGSEQSVTVGGYQEISAKVTASHYRKKARIEINDLPIEAARDLCHAIRAIKLQYEGNNPHV